MPTRRRPAPAAALALLAALTALAGCTSSAEPVPPPPTLEWPEALALDAQTPDPFWVVWTAVAEQGDAAADALQPSIDELGAAGYAVEAWDPACQSGAEEQLTALTGFTDVVAVGVPFASEQDAGAFDTLFEGSVVSVTPGAYTCAS